MNDIFVKTDAKEYPIHIEQSFDGLLTAIKAAGLDNRKLCIVTDSNVSQLYLDSFKKLFLGDVPAFIFEAGEDSKNLTTITECYEFFINNRLDRKSVVLALGGGVTGDMAGFAAATFMRGISFVQIPTTLLSMVDSSVGGKVGVDFLGGKNLIGAFYQPDFVYINTSTLKTLPPCQFASGMAEAVKHGFIRSSSYLYMITENRQAIKSLDENALKELILGSCKIKADVVSQDEKESGLREILNFGHTFGHAVETLLSFTLSHGECVSLGMVCALYLSLKKGNISYEDFENARNTLKFFDLPIKIEGLNPDDIYNQMFLDKKTKNNKLSLVLLSKIGSAYTTSDCGGREILDAIIQE